MLGIAEGESGEPAVGEDEGGGQVRAEKGLRVGDPHANARELALELIAPTFSADAASDTAPYPTGDADGGRYTDMDVMAVVKSPPLRMKRKCGTPGCTLEDFHLGPCTLDNKVNDDGGRAKREAGEEDERQRQELVPAARRGPAGRRTETIAAFPSARDTARARRMYTART